MVYFVSYVLMGLGLLVDGELKAIGILSLLK